MSNIYIKIGSDNSFANLCYLIVAVLTAMVGYHIHGSFGWAVVDFFFWPFAIIKWLICKQLTLTVIKATFAFFFA